VKKLKVREIELVDENLSRTTQYTVIQDQKGLAPLDPDTPPKACKQSIRDDSIQLTREKVPKGQSKEWDDWSKEAVHALLHFPEIFPTKEAPAHLLLLVLLAQVADLALPALPALPLIQLGSMVAAVPESIRLLLLAVQGPKLWGGRGWKLNRPWILKAEVPKMASVPSLNMFAYVGGHFNEGKAEKFWLPYQNLAFAVSPGTPEPVWSTLLHHSPLSIPILCGQSGHFRNRTVFNFNNAELTYTDTAMLENFQDLLGPVFWAITQFFRWFKKKPRVRKEWIKSADAYLPVAQNGRFSQPSQDPCERTLALALALFERFLRFSVRREWISEEDLESILQHFWSLTFPGSQPADESLTAPDAWKSPDCFWRFLEEYLGQVLVAAPDEKRSAETGAAVVQIKDEYLLIVPNANTAYADWLSKNDIPGPAQSGKWEIKVFHALLDAGIPMRTEKERDQWRYDFSGAKKHCYGIALPHLHEPVLTVLRGKFGATLDRWVPNLSSDGSLEGGEV
jgi:hypothetical protein